MKKLAYYGGVVPDPACPEFCWEPMCDMSSRVNRETIGRDCGHESQPRHTLVPTQSDHRLQVTIWSNDTLDMGTRQWVPGTPEARLVVQDAPDWQDRRPTWAAFASVSMNAADLTEHIAGLTAVRDELVRLTVPEQRS